jgi:acyl-CoA thioester hydrolase
MTFSTDIEIRSSDIDDLNHVNNVVYVRWAQEVATKHWLSVAPEEVQKKYSWVVLRHEVDYKSPAFLKDNIKGITWVADYNGPRSTRIVQFKRDEKTVCEVKTTWCLLDAVQMKPVRIPDEIMTVFKAPE